MKERKKVYFILLLALSVLLAGCGVPRSTVEQQQAALEQEKTQLQARIADLEKEISQLSAQLKEKETQFTALFIRFESLSNQMIKLKKETATEPQL